MTSMNKFGINDSTELARLEEKLSKRKAVWLFDSGAINQYKAELLTCYPKST